MSRRGVALVQALVVVAALAAIGAGLLAQARRAGAALALGRTAAQVQAYLDAGLAQARLELAATLGRGALRPGAGWDTPREVVIDRGHLRWQAADLQGRFNLAWLADPSERGLAVAEAFVTLAQGAGLAPGLAARLARAAGPDPAARASAFGAATPPEVPLTLLAELAALPTADEGGPAALARLAPLVATLPADAGFNPLTAPLPVLAALIPGVSARDWADFEAARRAGALAGPEALTDWAAERWSEPAQAAVAALPLGGEAAWIELRLEAELDGLVQARRAILAVSPGPDGRLEALPWLVLPDGG